jgi:hypothetical protein
MAIRGFRLAPSAVAVALIAGCGHAGSSRAPALEQLPLVDGATVVAQARQCDIGADAFCAVTAVIVNPRYESSGAFVASEHRRLRQLGWTSMAGDNGTERAADSPGHKLRLTYTTAKNDLLGWDLGWIKRPYPIVTALDRLLIAGRPSMSIMLEAGPT